MVVFRFWDRTWDPFRESKIFFSQNLTYSYSFLGWNLPGITMSSESLNNYFGITVKSRKNDEKFGFFRLLSVIPKECCNNCNIAVISGKLHPKKQYDQLFFPQKKKKFVRHPKMVVFRFWDRTGDPFRETKNFFSPNLTYSYSFLGWNLPGITLSLESLHNYFGITLKSRKNDEKFGFFDFCQWSRNNVGITATLR